MLALLIGGAVIGGLYAGSKVVDPVVDAFLQQVNDGRFGEAYAGLHPRFRETTPPEQFELFMRGVVDALGPYTSKSIRGINVNSANGVTTTVATYAMTFERGTATGTFTLTNGQIVRFDIDSPLVRSALECPHCGQTLDAFGNFCPHCGKPLTEAEETV
ncbi:MAG: hypothetical protein FJY92_02395 [Candidatus Hydrogenedentes bacterium]|nr:hypothetical protein [Candidatus Hydrogenedentota bacterium]